MTNRLPHSLRSDARDNRARILSVAGTIFAEQGLDVPMREIARRAEVGPATLYRHFPTKEALVTEVFTEQMADCTAIADRGLADPDPWRGFCRVIENMCEMQARDRGFTTAFVSAFPDPIDFAADRERALGKVAELADRAKAAGKLRPDFVLDDLVMVLMANGGIRTPSPATAVAASRRFAALLIKGMQAEPAIPPLPPAVRLPLTTVAY
ncbi:TetR/AcrR family transcriptional regulator [Streptomyces scabiei]|uniref:TetR/AcrR family transcriptional regulator n=1 Tax=Streptomyces TaxID=1883 RepID=UPI0029AEB043|nr:TetR/AcrR family transcriptional regulator [Streptomyces sp. ND04-05B]MDX3067769.1 TetR/AcrR family transcriptional regulator [Streptomyces sp. ND04-05B]